jgi:hypothetical protein
MKRLFVFVLCCTFIGALTACSVHKQSTASETTNQSGQSGAAKESSPKPETAPPAPPAQAGDLQPGQASGSYTAKGEKVELKYAYAGRAVRFGTESLVVLVTENPIPPEAVAEEIKSLTLLEGDKLRGLEYVLDENSMWVRYHPSQYQESSSNKLKEYKVENGLVRGIDDNQDNLSEGKYPRSVKFVATIVK